MSANGKKQPFYLEFTDNNPMVRPHPQFYELFHQYYGGRIQPPIPLFHLLQEIRKFDVDGDKSTPKEEHYVNFRFIVRAAKKELRILRTEMSHKIEGLEGEIAKLGELLEEVEKGLRIMEEKGQSDPAVRAEIARRREFHKLFEQTRKEKEDDLERQKQQSNRYLEQNMAVKELEERIGVVDEREESELLVNELEALITG